MEEILKDLGLTDKEARLYLILLEHPNQTAQQLAASSGFKRTNVYMLLDNLIKQQLVATKSDDPIKKFIITEPESLKKLLQQKLEVNKRLAASLSASMPYFRSQYSLSTNKPGVLHMEGTNGFGRLLNNMVNSKTEVLLVASNDIPTNKAAFDLLVEKLFERKNAGVHTRALFHNGSHRDRIYSTFNERGLETRFISDTPFTGEIVIYENNVAFTVYKPSITVTVLTDHDVAQTMRILFEQVWLSAD